MNYYVLTYTRANGNLQEPQTFYFQAKYAADVYIRFIHYLDQKVDYKELKELIYNIGNDEITVSGEFYDGISLDDAWSYYDLNIKQINYYSIKFNVELELGHLFLDDNNLVQVVHKLSDKYFDIPKVNSIWDI